MVKLLIFLQYKNLGEGGNLGFIWEMKLLSSDLPIDTVDSKSLLKFKKRLDHLKE